MNGERRTCRGRREVLPATQEDPGLAWDSAVLEPGISLLLCVVLLLAFSGGTCNLQEKYLH